MLKSLILCKEIFVIFCYYLAPFSVKVAGDVYMCYYISLIFLVSGAVHERQVVYS